MTVEPFSLPVGSLVTVTPKGHGIGKIKRIEGRQVEVERFRGIPDTAREVSWHCADEVSLAHLSHQTRCFVSNELGDDWAVGRLEAVLRQSDTPERRFLLHFPNGRDEDVPESRVWVRCAGARVDPVDVLIHGGQETPFFHQRRVPLRRSLLEQRAAAHGIPALLLARVRLLPHQVRVVRHVLEDPVQRYLLADEVGLGKTIEAAIILSQLLMDAPSAHVLVTVPAPLLQQWRRELLLRVGIKPSDARVLLCSHEAVGQATGHYELVVVDEAHHVAAWARHPEMHGSFEQVRCLAHEAPRLLLLSATPALHHEEDFLAMLHLLDPRSYRLEDAERFRRLVELRQPVGKFLLAFTEGVSRFALRRLLPQVQQLFPQDTRAYELAARLQAVCEREEFEQTAADDGIRELRVHICETHRLYRRMIRTARARLPEGTVAPRARNPEDLRETVREEPCDDSRYARVHRLLEQWRLEAADSGLGSDVLVNQYAAVLVTFLECSTPWLHLLDDAIACRLDGSDKPRTQRLSAATVAALTAAPLFEGEESLLTALRAVCQDEVNADELDPLDTLVESVRNRHRKGVHRCVVFASETAAAAELRCRLRQQLGGSQVLSRLATDDPECAERDTQEFVAAHRPVTLVCDRTSEEGLNLQSANFLFHADLPWDPNRLEQRIGRVDRIGHLDEVRSGVLIPYDAEDSLYEAWRLVLRDAFGVFGQSIADLQFFTEKQMPILRHLALEQGAEGLLGAIPSLRGEIMRERELLEGQAVLDEIEARARDDDAFFSGLDSCDRAWRKHQASFEDWVVQTMHFRRVQPDDLEVLEPVDGWIPDREAVRYEYDDYRGRSRTLLPIEDARILMDTHPGWATFNPVLARTHPQLQFLRAGEPFVEAVARQLENDDRGCAFALWRYIPSLPPDQTRLFFRLDFIVQADPSAVCKFLGETPLSEARAQALLRRVEAWFPPQHRTLFVYEGGRAVTHDGLLDALQYPYSADSKGGTDYNLNRQRIDALFEVVDRGHWIQACRGARDQARRRLRADADFQRDCQRGIEAALGERDIRLAQLAQGILHRDRDADPQAKDDLACDLAEERHLYEAMIAGIRKPKIVLDAVGAIVLSGSNPFALQATGDEDAG